MPEPTPSDWIERIRTAERSGDHVVAYDLAVQALEKYPESLDLRYWATLVLARSGATRQAAAQYARFGLDREHELEIPELGARIAKDCALAARSDRSAALRAAAAAYGRIYTRTRAYYPAINAATLYLLGGDHKHARLYAARALEASERGTDSTPLDRYYRLATRAEASLVDRNVEAARQALAQAAQHLNDNFDAAATTRKQLRLVCGATGTNPDILDVIRPPSVLHYDAPALLAPAAPRPPDRRAERALAAQVAEHLARHRVGFAYGSLTAGGEIICAEACLQAGLALNVVLPFNEEEFVATMVRPAGSGWVRRFDACRTAAKSVTLATSDSYQGDNSLFTYAGRLAMGMAILRAEGLETAALHLRLQTDGWAPDAAGYAASLKMWRARGRASRVLAPTVPAMVVRRAPRFTPRANRVPPRFSRALLFGDVKGFSKTPDYLIPVFQKRLMGTIAATLRRYGRHVLYRNSWGDAIYVVIDDPIVAAESCLAIQDALVKSKPSRYGLSADLSLRLAAHFGPVYDGHDPICDAATFFGAHTTIAARMEPVTPPGHVYVTEAMAAAIAMANAPGLRAEYVGNVPLAKGFGTIRMYALGRAI